MNPNIAIAILLITLVLLIMTKRPITLSMIISTVFTVLYIQVPVMTLVQQTSKQLNSFSLLVIPFLILMGEIMVAGGISSCLLAFASVCVRQIAGGLAYVNVLASTLFGGTSGSAIADVSPLGALEILMMEEAGYEKDPSIAVTVASSCQGLIIPPSHNMVPYPMTAGDVSMGSLFCVGHVPGIMLGVFIMGICYTTSKKKHYPKGRKLPSKEALRATKDTSFAMFAMVIVIGGVSAGFFVATESAVVACIYCLFVGFSIYRELRSKDIPVVLGNTTKTFSMVYALTAAAGAFGQVMTYLNVSTLAIDLLLGISDNKTAVLLLINLIPLLLGCVTDLASLVLIMAPILLPVVTKFGMSPIQPGVMMMLNPGIGLCTPPVGIVLSTGCVIGSVKTEKVSKVVLPLYIPMLITLPLVTFIPALIMMLPELIMKQEMNGYEDSTCNRSKQGDWFGRYTGTGSKWLSGCRHGYAR